VTAHKLEVRRAGLNGKRGRPIDGDHGSFREQIQGHALATDQSKFEGPQLFHTAVNTGPKFLFHIVRTKKPGAGGWGCLGAGLSRK
jgi:hypothetical protein